MYTNSHVGGHGAQGEEIAMLKLSQKGLFGCYSADFLIACVWMLWMLRIINANNLTLTPLKQHDKQPLLNLE